VIAAVESAKEPPSCTTRPGDRRGTILNAGRSTYVQDNHANGTTSMTAATMNTTGPNGCAPAKASPCCTGHAYTYTP